MKLKLLPPFLVGILRVDGVNRIKRSFDQIYKGLCEAESCRLSMLIGRTLLSLRNVEEHCIAARSRTFDLSSLEIEKEVDVMKVAMFSAMEKQFAYEKSKMLQRISAKVSMQSSKLETKEGKKKQASCEIAPPDDQKLSPGGKTIRKASRKRKVDTPEAEKGEGKTKKKMKD
eukprot:Trichotokara_eunicae@DN4150_c0_g1_i1.p1